MFADKIVGQPMYRHQAEVAKNPARIRVMCCGRQVGKSFTLRMLALHQAFAKPGTRVLIVSASENTAMDQIAEIKAMINGRPELFANSLDDEPTKDKIVLKAVGGHSIGSEIRCVPATDRQTRGKSVDLLILDEANQLPKSYWRSVAFTIVARPGSRVVLASTPLLRDHFFYKLFQQGLSHDLEHASFRWPSTENPLVDEQRLATITSGMTDREIRQEVYAEWLDDAGAFFTEQELSSAIADYEYTTDTTDLSGRGQPGAVAGVDWGFAVDAQALVLLSVLDDRGLNDKRHGESPVYFLPHIEYHHRLNYPEFIDRIRYVIAHHRVYGVLAEANGVGRPAIDMLIGRSKWRPARPLRVYPMTTTSRSKEAGYGRIKLLLQQNRLILPRHHELLSQLRCLTYERTDAGNTRIAVDERNGHDDLADSLMQAVQAVAVDYRDTRGWSPGEDAGSPIRKMLLLPDGTTADIGGQAVDPPRSDAIRLDTDVIALPDGTKIATRPRAWDLPLALQGLRKSLPAYGIH